MFVHNKQERTIAGMFTLTNTALHIYYGAYIQASTNFLITKKQKKQLSTQGFQGWLHRNIMAYL